MDNTFENYLSPFSWRYGSPEMRQIWSETHKRQLWRSLWIALAETQSEFNLVSAEQVADLKAHEHQVDMPRSLEIEAEIKHDLMAELKTFAEQCPVGGGVLHMGATSMDIEDNADPLRMRQALDKIIEILRQLLFQFCEKIDTWSETPIIGFTHLQPAEPSTLGYRFALYAQDLLSDWENLRRDRAHLKGKGFKGAVGTASSYTELLGADRVGEFETRLSSRIGLPFFPVTSQTYPRKQDYQIASDLAGLGGSLYKIAFDLRLLQSPPIGELSEPFGSKQVGSSAMPFKRNPIQAEKICSLARILAQMPRIAWDNSSHSLLERTLDDSANRRVMIPEMFLVSDELLSTMVKIISGLVINPQSIQKNFKIYGAFSATERLLMALSKAGADRQQMHEKLRQHALKAWVVVQNGEENPILNYILQDNDIHEYLDEVAIMYLMDASRYVGDAPKRAQDMAETIRNALE
jgi:adenylosuccinate lyase